MKPPRLLVQTRRADSGEDNETILRWEPEPRDALAFDGAGTRRVAAGTLVRIKRSGFAGHLDQAKRHYAGWSASLDWLKAFVETGETFKFEEVNGSRATHP